MFVVCMRKLDEDKICCCVFVACMSKVDDVHVVLQKTTNPPRIERIERIEPHFLATTFGFKKLFIIITV